MLMRYRSSRSHPLPHIVIQLRGGDKIKDELHDDYDYNITKGLTRAKHSWFGQIIAGGTCFFHGDDYALRKTAANAAVAIFGCRIVNFFPNVRHPSHIQTEFNAEAVAKRCSLAKEVFLDIETMATAKYVIALGVSNVVRVAALLRSCRQNQFPILDWSGLDMNIEKCQLYGKDKE